MQKPVPAGNTTRERKMTIALLKYANRAKVAEALTERGYAVSRMTVNRWARGGEMPGIAAELILDLFLVQGMKKQPTPFDWDRLIRTVEAIAGRVGVTEADLEAEARRAAQAAVDDAARLLPDDDGAPAAPDGLTAGR